METNTKTFTADEALEAVKNHRTNAITQLEYLIDDLTNTLKSMRDGALCVSNNPETQLKQVREEITKAQLMQRLHEYLDQPDTPNH